MMLPGSDGNNNKLCDAIGVKRGDTVGLELLGVKIRFDLFIRLFKPVPTMNDWKTLTRPIQYSFDRSWHYRVILVLVGALSLIRGAFGHSDVSRNRC
jgi:hypothetical protein